jgi:methionine--tRNA ligase beta chain
MNEQVATYRRTLEKLVGDEDPALVLSQTPFRIRTLITGVDRTGLLYKPSPTKWSISEIIAHLADSELVFAYRLRTVLTANGASLQAFDPDRWASTFDYVGCDAHASAELFSVLRMGTLRILRRIPAALMDNVGNHEEWGTESARSLVHLEAGHDKNHLAQIETLLEAIGAPPAFIAVEPKPEISIEVADKVDLRVGTIVDIVEVPDANRLVKLTVDFGTDKRTVIAGIRDERSDPRVLVGRQALFYYNLPRKKIRGQLSEAMLCDVGYADGIVPALLQPEWPVPNGTRAG